MQRIIIILMPIDPETLQVLLTKKKNQSGRTRIGWWHRWMKTAMITCFNNMAIRLIFIMTYEISQHKFATTLDRTLWTRRCRAKRWSPRSPDLKPFDFFLWGSLKDAVFASPVPANLQELRDQITAAVALIDRDTLIRVWNEFDHRSGLVVISLPLTQRARVRFPVEVIPGFFLKCETKSGNLGHIRPRASFCYHNNLKPYFIRLRAATVFDLSYTYIYIYIIYMAVVK